MNILQIFDFKTSLEKLNKFGLLDREKILFLKLSEYYNLKFIFLTYGTKNDSRFSNLIPKIKIVPLFKQNVPNSNFQYFLLSLFAPFKVKKKVQSVDIIRTYQIVGSWVGIILKFLYNKKVIVRGGF
ncbi:MAG: hypothetical protein ACTSUT_08435, partial [Promethearchaeota archaeon]